MRSGHAAAALILIAALAGGARADDPPRGLSPAGDGWPNPGEQVAIVVHGINPVHSDLDPLAKDLAERGFRVLRFVYDDRADLKVSARDLATDLEALVRATKPRRVALVAHSMGGLVARRALTTEHALGDAPTRFRLFTVATPFGGFGSANWAKLDFGLGPKVFDTLGSRSSFIRKPGALIANASHVKVETDEHGLELRGAADDQVKLVSQVQERVDAAAVERFRVRRGHVGSIRDESGGVPGELKTLLSLHVGPRRERLGAGREEDPRQRKGIAQLVPGS